MPDLTVLPMVEAPGLSSDPIEFNLKAPWGANEYRSWIAPKFLLSTKPLVEAPVLMPGGGGGGVLDTEGAWALLGS